MNFIEKLNINVEELTSNSFIMTIKLDDFHAQPQGFLNGGITLAFCEMAAGMASNKIIDNGFFAVGQSISANHLKAKISKGKLFARGTLLHAGRTSHVWNILVTDDNDNNISSITVQNSIVKIKE